MPTSSLISYSVRERLVKLMKSITLWKSRNKFQDQLEKDKTSIRKSKNAFIFADKTQNFYRQTQKRT